MAPTDSPFDLCKIRQSISLLPCHIGESRVGIDQEMTAQLMQYSDKLGGVILSFSNVKLERPVGAIMNEQPYIHCKVVADALVFRPRDGMMLEGVINKIGSNHIGMLVAGVFNGSVAASELPKGYVHNYAQDTWNGADGSSIAIGDTVEVKVVRVHVAGGMIAIEASMRHTKKPIRRKSLDLSAPAETKKPKKDKKSKELTRTEPLEEEPAPASVVSKKRKKDRSEAPVKEEPTTESVEVSKKKKSKKSKKE